MRPCGALCDAEIQRSTDPFLPQIGACHSAGRLFEVATGVGLLSTGTSQRKHCSFQGGVQVQRNVLSVASAFHMSINRTVPRPCPGVDSGDK